MTIPDLSGRVAVWRAKAADGTLTDEEMKEAVLLLRGGRASAKASSPAAIGKRAATVILDADDLLAGLD